MNKKNFFQNHILITILALIRETPRLFIVQNIEMTQFLKQGLEMNQVLKQGLERVSHKQMINDL